jgi:predicted TIM-barrel fold metal-dependent hydrolase
MGPVACLFAAASQPGTALNFKVPSGSCDCHTHIFDPERFPFAPTRTYTPEPATVLELEQMHRTLHLDRVVIVQASVYGTDNAAMLDALQQLGSKARGIAMID